MPEIFSAFALDYKFINGRLVVFELGNAFQSNQKRTQTLYGKSQYEEVIVEARRISKRKGVMLYRDFPTKTKSEPFERFDPHIYMPAFYSAHRKGLIVSYLGDLISRMGIYENKHLLICNAHVQATLKLKWLFYYHCNRKAELSAYIPKTYPVTKATLSWVKERLPDGEYYIKHSDGAFAVGTHRLQKKQLTWDRIQSNHDFRNERAMKAHPNHHTFIIQEMIRGDTVRLGRHHLPYERTRRAFVIAYGHVDQPSRMAIKVALPYFSISKSKGGESPDEKDFYRLDMSRDEEKAISSFARTLLGSLYDKRQRRFPKHWESMAKPLTGGGPHRVEKHERSLRLALIGQALMQEHYSSFEKIGSSNIGRLKRVIANLTPREKRIIDFDMQRFFTYALIGHPQWPMPAGFVNHGLLEAFATHLSDLTRAQIRFYKDHIEDRIRDCEPPSHPLHHNLAFLRKLRALVDVPPRRIIRKA